VVDLARAHARYHSARPDGLDLVLMGGGDAPLPDEPWLHRTGFVSDQVKHDALAGAAVVVVPSPYESLSFAQLEGWRHGRPTLANAASPVLVGQSRRSGGGLWYRDDDEYAAMIDLLARARPLAAALGRQGRRWVARECSWERVRNAWLAAIGSVSGGGARTTRLHSAP
jgi:glycosyltransferase involved in cell wall biosynthesis